MHLHVHDRLVYWRWSPQQIAARLKRMHPDDPTQHVSHETIYAAIYAHPRGSLKKDMVQAYQAGARTAAYNLESERLARFLLQSRRLSGTASDLLHYLRRSLYFTCGTGFEE